ncbi:unnamed protein product [Paramecium primaurelia]|uniref:Uncharacterized protein n=1 Tax=Paramecium primaurelia TaxID=5886 RepID=A0A8S1P8K8_PARPR|nr:unnamed protein product [Paramecium primaurelia]
MKMLDEIKQQVEKEMKKFDPRLAEKKYLKITQSIKDLFLKAVVSEKQTIKAAAHSIGINYSSAKAIWAEFRTKQKMKKSKKVNGQDKQPSSEVMKRCQYKILNGCNKIKKLFMEIKSSVAQRMNSTYMISLDGSTKVYQYFHNKKFRGASTLKGRGVETNIHTPKMKIQNSVDDQLIINNIQNLPFQFRQSPSIKLKNPRHSQDQTRKQTNKSEHYARRTRITVLESFYHQLKSDEDISLINNTQQGKIQPIILTPQSQTTYFSKQTQFTEIENIEEVHFNFVNMQQSYKSWIENFERNNHSK